VESWFENLLPDAARRFASAFQAALSGPSSSAFDLLTAVGRDCAGAVQVLPLDEKPSGLIRHRGDRCPSRRSGRVLRGVVAPPLLDPAAQQQESCGSPLAGLKRRRPCSTTQPVQAGGCGTVGQRKISARSPEPARSEIRKPRGPLAWGDQCLWPNPQPARRSAHVFWPRATLASACIHRAGVPPSVPTARSAPLGWKQVLPRPTGFTLDSGRFCAGRANPAPSSSRLSRPISHPAARWRGFEELAEQTIWIPLCWKP